MRTYPICDIETKKPFAFEIENIYLSANQTAEILRKVEGTSDVRRRRMFESEPDVRVKFRYHEEDYIVLEPYGDNSRYWVGPKYPAKVKFDITDLEKHFKEYKPPFLTSIIGDLLTWRIFRKNLDDK